MAQGLYKLDNPDNHEPVDLGDEETVIELGDDDLEVQGPLDDPELEQAAEMLKQPPPKRASTVRAKINAANYTYIDPSTAGWTIRLDMGEIADEELRHDCQVLRGWRNLGIFNIKFEKFGKHLVARISSSGNYQAHQFEEPHLNLLGKRRYQVVTTIPAECLRIATAEQNTAETIRVNAMEQARAVLSRKSASKIPAIEHFKFTELKFPISLPRYRQVEEKLRIIASIEGLKVEVQESGKFIRWVTITKQNHHPSQMLEVNHAKFLASFNPEIK